MADQPSLNAHRAGNQAAILDKEETGDMQEEPVGQPSSQGHINCAGEQAVGTSDREEAHIGERPVNEGSMPSLASKMLQKLFTRMRPSVVTVTVYSLFTPGDFPPLPGSGGKGSSQKTIEKPSDGERVVTSQEQNTIADDQAASPSDNGEENIGERPVNEGSTPSLTFRMFRNTTNLITFRPPRKTSRFTLDDLRPSPGSGGRGSSQTTVEEPSDGEGDVTSQEKITVADDQTASPSDRREEPVAEQSVDGGAATSQHDINNAGNQTASPSENKEESAGDRHLGAGALTSQDHIDNADGPATRPSERTDTPAEELFRNHFPQGATTSQIGSIASQRPASPRAPDINSSEHFPSLGGSRGKRRNN